MIRVYLIKILKSILFLTWIFFFTACKKNDSVNPSYSTINLTKAYHLNGIEEGNFIVDFQFTKKGTLWIGTFNGGLYQITENEVIPFTMSNSPLPDDRITDLFIDHLDRVWIATLNGFAKYDKEVWEVYTSDNSPIHDNVHQIAVNEKSEILLGHGNVTDGGLLFRSQDGQWKRHTTNNSELPCNSILEIETTNEGNFWVGTAQLLGVGGIAKFENGAITYVLDIENTGLLYNWIDHVEIGVESIWIGYNVFIYNNDGPDGGIQKIELESNLTTEYFPVDTKLISNRIGTMKLRSADNSLWFATSLDHNQEYCESCFSGIGVLSETNDIIAISTLNSNIAPNQYFAKINEDNDGNMYVATENTLYRLELK